VTDFSLHKVSVIIPTWNQSALVRSVLSTVQQQTVQPFEILVVDNGSTDDSAAVAQSLGAQVVRLSNNVGFAAAINTGVKAASGDWLLILNNDVELCRHWLEKLLRAAEDEKADFAAGKLLQARDPGRIDGTWDLVSRAGCAWRCGWNAADGGLWNARRRIQICALTASLIHRRIFDCIGLLDTRYESYYEDVDFGLRSALAGFSGVFEPQAVGRHWGSATLGVGSHTAFLVSRNQVLVAAKFGLWRMSRWKVLAGNILSLVPNIRQKTLRPALKGKWVGLRLCRSFAAASVDPAHLRRILDEHEAEIIHFQEKIGFDLSWRIYFGLTRRRRLS
jgi:GT2 family glycosyltransferase